MSTVVQVTGSAPVRLAQIGTPGVPGTSSGFVPSGTGVPIVLAGVMQAVAGAVNLASTSFVTGILALASVASPTGTGFPHVTSGAWDAAARAVNLASADVTGVLPSANVANLSGDVSGPIATTVVVQAQSGLYAFPTTTGLVTLGAVATTPGILQTTPASGVTPVNLTLTAQAPNAGSATTASGTPGSVNISFASPVSTGAEAFANIRRNSSTIAAIGTLVGSAPAAALYLGASGALVPSSSNYSLANLSGFLLANGASGIQFRVAGSITGVGCLLDNTGFVSERNLYVGTDPGVYGGGVGVLGLAKATTIPTASVSTGAIIYSDATTGGISLYPAGVTSPQFVVTSLSTSVAIQLSVGTTGTNPLGSSNGTAVYVSNGLSPPSSAFSGGFVLYAANSLVVYDGTSVAGLNLGVSANGLIASSNATTPGFSQTSSSIAAGVAMNISSQTSTFGNGGALNITAGGGVNTGGALTLKSGAATNTTGGLASLIGGNGVTTGGSVAITGGTGTAQGGSITITSGSGGGGATGTVAIVANATSVLTGSTTSAGFGVPLGGLGTSPLTFTSSTTIALGTSGVTTLSAAQAITPNLTLTTGTLTATVTLDFSTNGQTGTWFCDCTGAGTLGAFGITFKNGTQSFVLTTLPTGGLVIVRTSGSNRISIN